MNFPASRERLRSAPQEYALLDRFHAVRHETERLAAPLSAEDQCVQSMPDASPTKWHRAHTTWFFETFLLARDAGYRPFDPSFGYLFNSYYEAVGPRHARPLRGLLTRPGAEEISDYRAHVDEAMAALLRRCGGDAEILALVELGLNHEQQHQELILTDILHAFAQNSLLPIYSSYLPAPRAEPVATRMSGFDGGIVEIGNAGDGFAFDNESPRHETLLNSFAIADRLVTNGEWLEFMAASGYTNPVHWLADGWQRAREEEWRAPLYWRLHEGVWHQMTLAGLKPVDLDAPVTHVSYYEADAFARFRGRRLPTEFEWEHAATQSGARIEDGNFREGKLLRPVPGGASQFFGDVWEWTQSAYTPYPGFRPAAGAVGEYNGKFMVNQLVLRGGSCVTGADHIRASYRNFFYPHQRWQFSGLRLAEDRPRSMQSHRHDLPPLLADTWTGLSASPKRLPSKWLYDSEGARLFEEICDLPEYYLTRCETALLKRFAGELAQSLETDTALVEFGCGSCTKTRLLLDRIPEISTYVPIDICAESLKQSIAPLKTDYPNLEILPLAADFAHALRLPAQVADRPCLGFFSGSTIGNFDRDEAVEFLREAKAALGPLGKFLVAIDLVKNIETLISAYNDARGVTADFNRNILVRIRRELGSDVDLDAFSHMALWNERENRIEMHLLARSDQTLHVAGREFAFAKGETIHTENCHKFTLDGFARLAHEGGWHMERHWQSTAPEYALVLLG